MTTFGEYKEAFGHSRPAWAGASWARDHGDADKGLKVGDKATYAKGEYGHCHGIVTYVGRGTISMRITKRIGKYSSPVGDSIVKEGEELFTKGHV